ncbi:MAG: hypothetical protein U0990_08575 [Candidatus Nanopelagicales bacterium]|nr:hypothetical protein [Candidatus Nanopelagicales bacterium]MDZ4250131.1 hypothetical protein [Candidatus Nanopelagicales bacterium]
MVVLPDRLVVILYRHPLLGEGLAKWIRGSGADVRPVLLQDSQAVRKALSLGPFVVIFEIGDGPSEADLSAMAPGARIIDISMSALPGLTRPACASIDEIVQAIRDGLPSLPGGEPDRSPSG